MYRVNTSFYSEVYFFFLLVLLLLLSHSFLFIVSLLYPHCSKLFSSSTFTSANATENDQGY